MNDHGDRDHGDRDHGHFPLDLKILNTTDWHG